MISGPNFSELDESSTASFSSATTTTSGLAPIPEKSRHEDSTQSLPRSQQYSGSLEDHLHVAHTHHRKVVENDYVPDPQGSPQMPPPQHRMLQRAYTVGEDLRPMSRLHQDDPIAEFLSQYERDTSGEAEWNIADLHQYSPTAMSCKHFSMVSMESGLGYEPDERDDFNPTLPLELQPWFHHKMARSSAEALVQEDGDFLVHENPHFDGTFTVTVQWCHVPHHVLISSTEVATKMGDKVVMGHKYQFDNGAFDTIPELLYNHLRYQIPISRDIGAILSHPICKFGNRPADYNSYVSSRSVGYLASTLPKSFGRHEAVSAVARHHRDVTSPDVTSKRNSTLRPLRSSSFSPTSSSHQSPARDSEIYVEMKTTASTSNIFDDHDGLDEDDLSNMVMGTIYSRNTASAEVLTAKTSSRDGSPYESRPRVLSPQGVANAASSPYGLLQKPGSTSDLRPQSKTESYGSVRSRNSSPGENSLQQSRKPTIDPDDYEVMESVSIRETIIPSPLSSPKSSKPPSPLFSPRQAHSSSSLVDAQYATIQPKAVRQQFSTPMLSVSGYGNTVKYAEITFNQTMNTSRTPGSTGGYASRSDLLRPAYRNRSETVTYASPRVMQSDNMYSIPRPSPHPFSNYVTIMPLPAASPSPLAGRPRSATTTTTSPYASRSMLVKTSKAPQNLQEVAGYLNGFSVEELAVHLTKADAVCFLLTPRPGENEELWQNR